MNKKGNALINETSPYLLQHAHNPVNWYPWNEIALSKAKEEDKPILISIGYSACHWCHVMERESFEDEATAKIMNDNFICIKIDREERPDLDQIYMEAVQVISGSGGWPLNVFLTPDRKPFYGGTYFPPVKAFNRASWKDVLLGIKQLFTEKREQVEAQAEELTTHIMNSNGIAQTKNSRIDFTTEIFTRQQSDLIFENIMKQADTRWGGFGHAPKFPQTGTIQYLLRYYHFTKNETALKQACLSLDKMIDGGLYDHLSGGFARYSTDEQWLVPHFEKMLYDNALIISALCDAYQLTKNIRYKKIVEQTIGFLQNELMFKETGKVNNPAFYAALDADSEGIEGKYYVWGFKEIAEILKEDALIFCQFYGITESGNWKEGPSENEPANILYIPVAHTEFAHSKNISEDNLQKTLDRGRERLLKERNKKIRPGLDDKIILGWNALMNIALSKAAAAFDNPYYRELAIGHLNFLWEKFQDSNEENKFYHTYKNGVAKYPAFLDDYAYLVKACIHLQEITGNQLYLERAYNLVGYIIQHFSSEEGFYFYTRKDQQDVIVRKQEVYDSATPSGNSIMAGNLNYLGTIYDNRNWKQKAVEMVDALSEVIIKYPTSFGTWSCLLADISAGINEIAITGPEAGKLKDEFLQHFIPNKVLQSADSDIETGYPLISGKNDSRENTFIYVCKNFSCNLPVNTVEKAINQLLKI
ncbi:MAG: thioredoxin domain-containing protein [Chitinophagaceae bacterium]|nr:thioredoxin domain-containing protein [Chitinophagaceae bacterium]